MALPINNGLVAFLLRLRAQQTTDKDRARCDALISQLAKDKS